jgi:hypothetical protein
LVLLIFRAWAWSTGEVILAALAGCIVAKTLSLNRSIVVVDMLDVGGNKVLKELLRPPAVKGR